MDNPNTTSFRNALRRFLALWGAVHRIRSDQGTNFVGSRSQDKEGEVLLEDLVAKDEVQGLLQSSTVAWEFNPVQASHRGGVWERKIGSVKRVLEGALGAEFRQTLTREELDTFLREASAIVNGTPLWAVKRGGLDRPLTPAMLCTGKWRPNPAPPDSFSENDLACYGIRRWRRIQALAEIFWKAWRTEYLQTLQKRKKWSRPRDGLRVGDIVLLKNKNVKRNRWPIARVLEEIPGKDGRVRKVRLVISAKGGGPQGSPQDSVHLTRRVRAIQDCVFLTNGSSLDAVEAVEAAGDLNAIDELAEEDSPASGGREELRTTPGPGAGPESPITGSRKRRSSNH